MHKKTSKFGMGIKYMNKSNTIYEKYGNYFLKDFLVNKNLKFDIVKNDEKMFAVYIYSKSDFCIFLRIEKTMIYLDGTCFIDEGDEFEDITKIPENEIYSYLDKYIDILKVFFDNCILLYAFKDGQEEVATSTDVLDRNKLLKNLDIREFYNKNKVRVDPPFEELDRIELRDFYNNVVYEYDVSKKGNN